MITLRNASFGYNRVPIVRGVTVDIQPGNFIGVIGPNGAGKSTLLKGILKLLPPLEGSVSHNDSLHQRIGYVPQRDELDAIFPLTVFEVVRLGIIAARPWYRWPNAAVTQAAKTALKQVEMLGFAEAPFAELSSGQRQRVLIARALSVDPRILILDEPTAGIDPAAEKGILELLTQLNREQGLSILMVSHHMHSLQSCVRQALFVKEGTVVTLQASDLTRPDYLASIMGVLS